MGTYEDFEKDEFMLNQSSDVSSQLSWQLCDNTCDACTGEMSEPFQISVVSTRGKDSGINIE